MNAETQTHANNASTATAPVRSGLTLQRKCSCGGAAGLAGKCDDCEKKKLAAGALQKKLTVNEPGDAYEQEADRVAEGVMRMPAPVSAVSRNAAPAISRAATGGGGSAEAPGIVHDVLRSSGQPLDSGARAFMEPRFGHDFSGVRVHTDARAAESARAVNALAYTVGKDVVFGEGQYAPGSGSGQRLLAHELTHVVQQGGSARENRWINSAQGVNERNVHGRSILWPAVSEPLLQRESEEQDAAGAELEDEEIESLGLIEPEMCSGTQVKCNICKLPVPGVGWASRCPPGSYVRTWGNKNTNQEDIANGALFFYDCTKKYNSRMEDELSNSDDCKPPHQSKIGTRKSLTDVGKKRRYRRRKRK